jgi:membrane-associated phospholipid phosphatase
MSRKEGRVIDRGLRPADWATVLYLGVTLGLLLLRGGHVPGATLLAALHVAGIGLIVAARKAGAARWPLGNFVLSLYPIPLFALLYSEVGTLNQIVHPGVFFDADILSLEERLFGGQPSRDLYARHGSRLLGEYLSLGYFSYYFLVPILGGALWLRRPLVELERALGTVCTVFYVSFLFFIFYPVAGPYYEFPHPPAEGVGYVLPRITRWLLDRGSSVGAAFPSSHVAVSVVTWIMAMRYCRPLAVFYLFLVPALALGAINGGYHYATDVAAGAILGILIGVGGFLLLDRVWRPVQAPERAADRNRSGSMWTEA